MKSLDKDNFDVEIYVKSDEPEGVHVARKISKLIEDKPELLETHPQYAKYKDWEQNNQAKKQEALKEKPGIRKDPEEDAEKSLSKGGVGSGIKGHVSSVAVLSGTKLLMGKRSDTGKWTLPGGKANPNESHHEAAKRELKEEAGIEVGSTKHIGSEKVDTREGRLMVHAHKVEHDGQEPNSKNDPDKEVKKWEWVETKNGLPKHVLENLHSKKNVVLNKLGLQKGKMKDFFYADIEAAFVSTTTAASRKMGEHGSEPIFLIKGQKTVTLPKKELLEEHKRLIHVLESPSHKDDKKEAKRQSKELEEYKSELFIFDLIKASQSGPRSGHKYIRRYRRGNRWVYIYHEAGQRGRPISEEAVGHLKQLSELGDEEASKLYRTIEEYGEEKINILRKLADLGDEQAKDHLKNIGIDREAERMEEQIAPAVFAPPAIAISNDPIDAILSDEKRSAAIGALKENIEGARRHLENHRDTEIARKILPELQSGRLLEMVSSGRTPREILDSIAKVAEKLEELQGGTAANWPGSDVTYGNAIYNKSIERLKSQGIITSEYYDLHKRTARAPETKHAGFNEIAAIVERKRAEKEAQERAEQERLERELGELTTIHGESARDMLQYFAKEYTPKQRADLIRGMDKMFGKAFKFKEFRDGIQGNPEVNVKIGDGFIDGLRGFGATSGSYYDVGVGFSFIEKSSGRKITGANRTITKNSDGSIEWNNGSFSRPANNDLQRYPGMGKGLYNGVEKFLKKITENWSGVAKENTRIEIGTCANGGFGDGYKGALVWAKHYFDFDGGSNATYRMRDPMKSILSRVAPNGNLKQEHVDAIKAKLDSARYPYEFVRTGFAVNKDQARAMFGSMDWDFKRAFEEKGYVDIGELLLIASGVSWSGVNYINKNDSRFGPLNEKRTAYYGGQLREPRPEMIASTVAPPPSRPAAASTTPQPQPIVTQVGTGARLAASWSRRVGEGRKTVITKTRLARLARLADGDIREFLANANITRAARRRVSQILTDRGVR